MRVRCNFYDENFNHFEIDFGSAQRNSCNSDNFTLISIHVYNRMRLRFKLHNIGFISMCWSLKLRTTDES